MTEHLEATPASPGGGQVAVDDRIWLLLDRSGSMSSIASDVIGGLTTFVREQQSSGPNARLTFALFDSQAPFEIVAFDVPIREMSLADFQFEPRGGTPLFDAIGLLLDQAEAASVPPTSQLVVVFTDGLENASSRWTRDALFGRIERLRAAGWTFVFLGANQDSYASGGDLGFVAGNVSDVCPSLVADTFEGLAGATRAWRAKPVAKRVADRDDFFDGNKPGEAPRPPRRA